MATCKFGPIVSDVRGALGGAVFTRARAGAVVRSRTKAVVPISNAKSDWAAIMSSVYRHWLHVLSQEERDSWAVLAADTLFTNALGSTYRPSSYNLFFRSASLKLFVDHAIVDIAPESAVATYFQPTYAYAVEGGLRAQIEEGPAGDDQYYFYSAGPTRPTLNYFRGPWSLFAIEPGSQLINPTTLFEGLEMLDGQVVFIRSRVLALDGSLSAPYVHRFLYEAA